MKDEFKVVILYDEDYLSSDFEDWYWGLFLVDDLKKAQRNLKKWLNEYLNDEDAQIITNRYDYIIKKAKEYGYTYLGNDYIGFGC